MFDSIEHALYVAYALEHEAVSCKSSTQIVLEALQRKYACAQTAKPSVFSGLDAQAVRAQCAMIRSTTERNLKPIETFCVWSRYGWYSTKKKGLDGLSSAFTRMTELRGDVVFDLLCSFYNVGGYSLKGAILPAKGISILAQDYEVPTRTMYRWRERIAEKMQEYETQAHTDLRKYLVAGVVKDM